MRLNHAIFLTIVRASAAYDLLLTAPFATPWTFAFAHAHLVQWLPVKAQSGNSTARAPLTSAAPMRSSRGG